MSEKCPHCRRPLIEKIRWAYTLLVCRFCGSIKHKEEGK